MIKKLLGFTTTYFNMFFGKRVLADVQCCSYGTCPCPEFGGVEELCDNCLHNKSYHAW